MIIESEHTKKEYLSALKFNMNSHFALGEERFTGFFAGKLFYVTHHAGYAWSEKITNQKNAAMGYVKETDSGCEVRFICLRGILCPLVFIPLLAFFLFLFQWIPFEMPEQSLLGKSGWITLLMFIYAPFGAFFESLTYKSQRGQNYLIALLKDPVDLKYYHSVV